MAGKTKKTTTGKAEKPVVMSGAVPEWSSTTAISKLLGKTVRRIQQLTQEGVLETEVPPGGGARKYRTCETVQRYIAHVEQKAQETGENSRAAELNLKKLQAEVDLKESQGQLHRLKTAIAEGKYISADQATEELAEFLATFKKFAIQEMIARQQEIVNGARAADRDLTAEEQTEFNGLQHQIDAGQGGEPAGGAPAGGPAAPATPDAGQAVTAERQRISDIVALCRQTGMEPDQYIRSGATMDTVRTAALEHLMKHGRPLSSRMNDDPGDNFRAAATDALLMRTGVNVANPAQGVEQFRGMSLRDLAIECMARDGQGSTTELLRMGKDDLWTMACRQFFNPTSAFPAILDNTIRKTIENRYRTVPTTFQLWTSKGSVTDFKPTKDHSYLAGGAGEFLLVGENGELKHDTPKTELLPQRKVDTYGRQFSMSRQAFINDDIGFITEVPGLYAASAKRTINKQVYSILTKNPAIFDGVTLFNTAHNNLITAGAKPSIDTLQAIMLKLLRQTDPFGEAITIQPRYIIVPVGYGFLLSQLLETQQISVDGIGNKAVNPLYNYRNQLQVIEEGTLNVLAGEGNAVPWFMVGDPSYAKSIQVDYLNGQETPTIRRSEVPGQLGYVWDIWLDWGITAVDFRGIAKNPGVTIE